MPHPGAILLLSDRLDYSRGLAEFLEHHGYVCRLIGLDEHAAEFADFAAVVTDVHFQRSRNSEHVRYVLGLFRNRATPILAILRDNSRFEQVQAAALGVSSFVSSASFAKIAMALARCIQPPAADRHGVKTVQENAEIARLEFGKVLRAASCNEAVARADVESAATSVLSAVMDGGIRRWLEVIWSYDDATYQHCMLVTGLSAEFANVLNFGHEDQKHLVRGAVLHDLGKARIPLAILNKADHLDAQELEIMRMHPNIGYQLLREQGDYEPELLDVVLRHHELLDGSGYPDGLSGSQISDLVRLVTICDIYAAMIERRPYRQPMHPGRAFAALQGMGGKLETVLVREFARVVENSAAALAA